MLTPSLLKSTFHLSLLKGEEKKSNLIYFAAGLISIIHIFFHPLVGSAVLAQMAYNNKNLETKKVSKSIPTGELKVS